MLFTQKYGPSIIIAALFSLALAQAGSVPRLDTSWKRYRNPGAKFCLSYPSKWLTTDAYDGSGIVFSSGAKRHSRPSGEIDISALPAPDSLTEASFTLGGDYESHLDGLKRFARAKDLQILDRRETVLLGTSALWAKDRYTDPLDHSSWLEELVLTRRQNVLYRIELECRSDQAARFETVFNQIVASFQIDCN